MTSDIKPARSRKACTPLYKNDEEINGILHIVEDLVLLGATEADICEALGYSRKSRKAFTRLKRKFPQLDATIRSARMQLGAKITNTLLQCALGGVQNKRVTTKRDQDGCILSTTEEVSTRGPDISAIALILASQYGDFGWRKKDRVEIKDNTINNMQIDEAHANLVSNLSNEELIEMISTFERKLRKEKSVELLKDAEVVDDVTDQ